MGGRSLARLSWIPPGLVRRWGGGWVQGAQGSWVGRLGLSRQPLGRWGRGGWGGGSKGPGPGRLGFGLGGNLNGEVEGRVGGYIDNIIIL